MLANFTRPFKRFARGFRSGLENARRVEKLYEDDGGYGEPFELADNDRHDSYLDTHFKSLGDLWSHANPEVRRSCEEKAHQETSNNGFLQGAAKQYAQEAIGANGPNFEVNLAWEQELEGVNAKGETLASEYERLFTVWLDHIQFARKMRQIVKVEMPRGEGLGYFHPVVEVEADEFEHPIHFDFKVVDARRLDDDHLGSMMMQSDEASSDGFVEGVRYDAYGKPLEYKIDRVNPAQKFGHVGSGQKLPKKRFDKVSAKRVVHWFQWDHPEQRRGFTQYAAAVLPATLIRRGGMSVTKGLKNSSQMFGWIETPVIPEDAMTQEGPNGEKLQPIRRKRPGGSLRWRDNMMKVLGGGQKVHMTDQKLPSSGMWEHFNSMIGWIGRCICAPLFMLSGDYSKANFTSTRAGYQPWDCYIATAQADLVHDAFRKALRIWHNQAVLLTGYMSEELKAALDRRPAFPPVPHHMFHFGSRPAISPSVEAIGNKTNLATGKSTHNDVVRSGDPMTRWRGEAKKKGIPFDVYVAMKEAFIHGVPFDKLLAAMRNDSAIEPDEPSEEEDDESEAEGNEASSQEAQTAS